MKLGDAQDRAQAVIIGAAVVAHAMISSGKVTDADHAIAEAFDIAEKFLAEAERRVALLETKP